MTVSTFVQPNHATQTVAAWTAAVDGDFSVLTRSGVAFAPHAQASPNMTVALDAGHVFDGRVLTEVAAQNTGSITAPTTNPRIDRVVIDRITGVVSIVTGTESASPTAPAIPLGKCPVARVALTTSTTSITNAIITDERDFSFLGARREMFSVMDYGAVGNGSTDDSTAVQAAIDAAAVLGGTVVFPVPPVAYVCKNLNLKSNVALQGLAPAVYDGGVKIQPPATTDDIFQIATGIDNFAMSGLFLRSARRILWFKNVPGTGTNGHSTQGSIQWCTFQPAAQGTAIHVDGQMERVYFTGCMFANGDYGFYLSGTRTQGNNSILDKTRFDFCHFAGQTKNAVYVKALDGTGGSAMRSCQLTGIYEHAVYFPTECAKSAPWTFIDVNCENAGGYVPSSSRIAPTTGSISAGSASLTVASATGLAVNDYVTVQGAASGYEDLTAQITAVAGTTLTLNTAAGSTVSNVQVTKGRYSTFVLLYGTGQDDVFITCSGGGEESNQSYFIYDYAPNVIGCVCDRPVYSSQNGGRVIGHGIALRQPFDSFPSPGPTWLPAAQGAVDLSGVGPRTSIPSPPGRDWWALLTDSASSGTGSFGNFVICRGASSSHANNLVTVVGQSGTVGIGLTPPDTNTKLDVCGDGGSVGNIDPPGKVANFAGPSSANGTVSISSNDVMAANVGGSVAFGGRYHAAGDWRKNWVRLGGYKQNGTSDNLAGYFFVDTRASNGTWAERMRIDGSGNVGIGASPVADKLEVSGAIRAISSSANFSGGPEGGVFDYNGSAVRVGHINGASGSAKPVSILSGGNVVGQFKVQGASDVNYGFIRSAPTGGNVDIGVDGSDANITPFVYSKGTDPVWVGTNGGNLQFAVTHTASVVNYGTVTGSITGNGPIWSADGSDTNINQRFRVKGTDSFYFQNGSGVTGLQVGMVANQVNYPYIFAAPTGNGVGFRSNGSDSNVDTYFQTKGAGGWYFSSTDGSATQVRIDATASATRFPVLTGSNGGNPPIRTSAGSLSLGSTAEVVRLGVEGGSTGGVVFINNLSAAPSSNPSGGGFLFCEGGALKYRGSSGTVTTIAPA